MKSFLVPLTEPIGAIWALMLAGVIWNLCWKQWRTALWLGVPTLLLFLIGSTPLAEALVASEESRWGTEDGRPRTEDGGWKTQDGTEKTGHGNRLVSTPSAVISPPSSGSGLSSVISPPSSESGLPSVDSPLSSDQKVVIALGGGYSVSRNDPLQLTIGEAGDRYLAAAELIHKGDASVLVLGGSGEGQDTPDVPEALTIQRWLERTLLSNSVTITNLGICRATMDEALAAKVLMDAHNWTNINIILVTSALHMRRAEAVFRKQGVQVSPQACDFQVYGVSRNSRFSIFPQQGRFVLLSLYLHEKIGFLVYRLRGWI